MTRLTMKPLRKRIEMAGRSGFFGTMSRGVNQLADNAGEANPLATAARQVKDLIQDSVKKVEDESVPVAQSGRRLNRLCCSRRGPGLRPGKPLRAPPRASRRPEGSRARGRSSPTSLE
jgi:hypothetical protein